MNGVFSNSALDAISLHRSQLIGQEPIYQAAVAIPITIIDMIIKTRTRVLISFASFFPAQPGLLRSSRLPLCAS